MIITVQSQTEVDGIENPKAVWYDINRIVIYTGDDINLINPPPTQEELDKQAAGQYAKLIALRNMTPTQVQSWIDANINNLADAKDALKTLAVAVGILARKL